MNAIILVALGGALGAAARYITMEGIGKLLGFGFPYGTLTVNVIGSFLMGILIAFLARHTLYNAEISQEIRLFLAVGLLGGYTTFSAFSLDVVTLIERGEMGSAFTYVIASVVFSVGGLFAGLFLMRAVS